MKIVAMQTLAAALLFAALGAAQNGAGTPDDGAGALWRDATFQKQFVGGYGIASDVEPRVTKAELELLEKLRPLMGDKLPEAEAMLKERLQADSSAMLDFTLGSIRFQQDRPDEAVADFRRAVTKFPSFRRAWRGLGFLHVRQSQFAEAIDAFTRWIALGGGEGYAYGLLGFAYSSQQDYQAAETAYRNALLLEPDKEEWRLGLTRTVFKQQKYEDAAALLDALLARKPDHAEFWLLQAHTYLGLKQPLRAATDFEIIDRLGKSTVDTLHTLAEIYVGESLPDLAAGAYCRSLDLDPKQPFARALRAVELLAARGAAAQARVVAKKVHAVADATLADADRRKLLKVEARLAMAEGDSSADTVKVLEEITALDPLDGEALMLLAQHWSRQNEPDRAILWYERAEGIEAFEATAKVKHAQVLVRMGRYQDALPLLRRAQEVKSRDDVARYLEQVERAAKAGKR